MANFAQSKQEYLSGLRSCLDEIQDGLVEAIVDTMLEVYGRGGSIFILGNGGSAATASHFACDLSKTAAVDGKPRLKAASFTDNVPLMTAISNDISYTSVFKEQLVTFLNEGDLVICISASGNSPNVLEAARYARTRGATVVGFIGCDGGQLQALADKAVTFCSRDYGQIEDAHLVLAHIIAQEVGRRLKAGK